MAFFRVATTIHAPPERVWQLLLDWEGSQEWMVDATTVEVVGAQREGVGTRIRAVTDISGIPITDELIVTRWEPLRLIQVHHRRRPIRGIAWFELKPQGKHTFFEWAEELDPPFGPLGEAAGRALRHPIERLLQRSTLRLRALAESAK